jgi:catechol 2,3-dioxygenase-like lactoylglutathione lyase family enzyme
MTIELNHTIVRSHDAATSAEFLAEILGLPVGKRWGPFLPIALGNGAVLEFLEVGEEAVQSQHYAFLVDNDEFDTGLARIQESGIDYWADPFDNEPRAINTLYGGRGVYFVDPSGHKMELMTVPYGENPE